MESKEIISGSKIIAKYLEWRYIPFNDLQGFPKAGYYKTKPKTVQRNSTIEIDGEIREVKIDFEKIMYTKNGWVLVGENYCKYVCRNHGELRFWNSWDALIPVIEKIEKDFKVKFHINNGGCEVRVGKEWKYSSFKTELTWLQNTFNTVVKILENGK
jgi:hypothetical protein